MGGDLPGEQHEPKDMKKYLVLPVKVRKIPSGLFRYHSALIAAATSPLQIRRGRDCVLFKLDWRSGIRSSPYGVRYIVIALVRMVDMRMMVLMFGVERRVALYFCYRRRHFLQAKASGEHWPMF